MHQNATWYGGRTQLGDFVLDEDPAPSQKGRSPKNFGPNLLWPNGWMYQDGTSHGGRPQPRRLCVRWGPSPLPKKRAKPPPQFSAYFYCGQTPGCIKIALGMEVCLGPCHIVLDGDRAPLPKKGAEPPIFGPFLLRPNGWMDQDVTWYRGRLLSPGDFVLDGHPARLPKKRAEPSPVAKRLH